MLLRRKEEITTEEEIIQVGSDEPTNIHVLHMPILPILLSYLIIFRSVSVRKGTTVTDSHFFMKILFFLNIMKKPYSKHGKLTLLDQFTYLLLRNSSALSNVAIETILHQNIIKPCKEQTHAEQSFQYFEAIELPHSQRQHAEYS